MAVAETAVVGESLAATVARVARAHPEATALNWGHETMAYAELDRRANRLAHLLKARGVGPDVPVAIGLERGPALPIAILAVLKAGGAYVPLDAQYPAERLRYMIANSRAPVVLTETALAARFGAEPARTLLLDTAADALAGLPDTAPEGDLPPDALTYVIYTSGSTGQPKGVAMGQRALRNLIDWQLAQSPPGAADRTLQFAPISFDVSFQELFATWAAGGTLVLIPEDARRDFRRLLDIIETARVTRLFLPFVALHALAETVAAAGRVPATLREVITAGEQLQITPAIRAWFGRVPACRLVNQYGPSETHVVTAYTLAGPPDAWPPLPPIGAPVANVRIDLLDDAGALVADGAAGELYVGGVAVARGYLHRPDLTAERFVADPHDPAPDARRYRTGDLARRRPDGDFEYLGRVDAQVKIRGYRVELGEIETALRAHPAVKDAAAALREDAPGDKRLIGYVVPRAAAEPLPADLPGFLAACLPDYMRPAALVTVTALPLTPSGKVDRRALPAPEQRRPELAAPFMAPHRPAEQALAVIWSELLRVAPVGLDDNFFELGGNSLLAMQLLNRLQTQYHDREWSAARLFELPTVRAQAAFVEGAPAAATAPSAVAAAAAERARRQRAAYAASGRAARARNGT